MPNQQEIIDTLVELRKKGWKVKKVKVNEKIDRFRCNKKHISFRAKYMGTRWLFEIYARNLNGGYNKIETSTDLNIVIGKAIELSKDEAPKVPIWNKNNLPEPFKLNDAGRFLHYSTRCGSITFDRIVSHLKFLDIVAIAKNCTVSIEAAMLPENDAWFLMAGQGTSGTFYIISNGEEYYPIYKKSISHKHDQPKSMPVTAYTTTYKYKISFSKKVKNVDFDCMNHIDAQAIRIACEQFAKQYAHKKVS